MWVLIDVLYNRSKDIPYERSEKEYMIVQVNDILRWTYESLEGLIYKSLKGIKFVRSRLFILIRWLK